MSFNKIILYKVITYFLLLMKKRAQWVDMSHSCMITFCVGRCLLWPNCSSMVVTILINIYYNIYAELLYIFSWISMQIPSKVHIWQPLKYLTMFFFFFPPHTWSTIEKKVYTLHTISEVMGKGFRWHSHWKIWYLFEWL